MSLAGVFNSIAQCASRPFRRRPGVTTPFSIRLSAAERERLCNEAASAPLGTYIRSKILGATLPIRTRRTGLPLEDRKALAQAVALLGRSNIANNLNQLARAAHIGALPVTPAIEAELSSACAVICEIRRLLMIALGLKPDCAP